MKKQKKWIEIDPLSKEVYVRLDIALTFIVVCAIIGLVRVLMGQ